MGAFCYYSFCWHGVKTMSDSCVSRETCHLQIISEAIIQLSWVRRKQKILLQSMAPGNPSWEYCSKGGKVLDKKSLNQKREKSVTSNMVNLWWITSLSAKVLSTMRWPIFPFSTCFNQWWISCCKLYTLPFLIYTVPEESHFQRDDKSRLRLQINPHHLHNHLPRLCAEI